MVIEQFPNFELEKLAIYNPITGFHEANWSEPNNGEFLLTAYVEDSSGNIGKSQIALWYYCQPIRYNLEYLIVFLIDYVSNSRPNAPIITGPNNGYNGESYMYQINSTDPDNDDIFYYVDWGDGTNSGWQGLYDSGVEFNISHVWSNPGIYLVKAKTRDSLDKESSWTRLLVLISGSY